MRGLWNVFAVVLTAVAGPPLSCWAWKRGRTETGAVAFIATLWSVATALLALLSVVRILSFVIEVVS